MMNEPVFQPPPKHDFRDDIWRGIGLVLLLHLVQVPFALYSQGVTLLFMWLSQLVYVMPAMIVVLIKQRYGMAVGVLIAAALTVLLSVAICGGSGILY
jgi:hypothetical protein